MASTPLITRHALRVRCDTCAGLLPVHFTLHRRPNTPAGIIRITIRIDPADLVMGRIFSESHRGPFTKEPQP